MAEFFASKDWQTFLDVLPSIPAETWDTFYSTVVATLFALVIGLPLGVLLVTGEPGGVRPLPRWAMRLVNGLINLLRSVPFLILMIIVIPLSRLIVGTSIGTVASIVPLVIASFPFVSRLVETSIREVDSGEGVFILADLLGGTPCNRSMYSAGEKVRLITGLSLPMLLSLLSSREDGMDMDSLSDDILSDAAAGAVDVNRKMKGI